jgi:Protein of unknown function DUF2625
MKQILLFITFILCQNTFVLAQKLKMKSLQELINKEDPGWPIVKDWIKEAKNKVEILPKTAARADSNLLNTQVTTRSPMGAVIYETGGILIDNGWIRILGSGSPKLDRGIAEWNKGKSFKEYGEPFSFVLIADDAVGGFFAINGGGLGKDLGKLYYFSPDNLEWEAMEIGYSDFLVWAFQSDLEGFYKGYRWKNWKDEVAKLDGKQAFQFFPYLWVKHDGVEKLSRKAIPIEEIYSLHQDFAKQFKGGK